MSRALIAWLCLLSLSGAHAQGALGDWWTPGFNARVRIEPCGDAVCGRIVWLWDETAKDSADKSLPHAGLAPRGSGTLPTCGHTGAGAINSPRRPALQTGTGTAALRRPTAIVQTSASTSSGRADTFSVTHPKRS